MIRNKPTLKAEAQNAVSLLIKTLFFMIIGLSISYIAIVNTSAERNYALEQEKLKNEDLKSDQIDLTTDITKKTAFDEIKDNDKLKSMEEIKEKQYLREEDNDIR
ncbi:hypothetical protein HY604_00515 [Candidatus Peregrinibacteria bacterium]|nr:hypothetical protein [Candidatus Peregrinibacteria bacterium]